MICFDLEGPLSPQDNAYEVMKLAENGGKVFEALSEYDDILALEGRPGYEPGDTLKLIVPFLKYYGITEADIKVVSEGAVLVQGMKEAVSWLKNAGRPVRIISTSYQQHAHTVGRRIGVSREEIASTKLNLKDTSFENAVMEELGRIEEEILSEGLTEAVTRMLDGLYFSSGLFDLIGVEVVGGQRKVDALLAFAEEAGADAEDIVAIGDSITDYKMLREVSRNGGLAIAFNANQYCLPYADIAIATLDGRAILPVVQGFIQKRREGALKTVEELEQDVTRLKDGFGYLLDLNPRPLYSLIGEDEVRMQEVLGIHKAMRMVVRGEAGKLG